MITPQQEEWLSTSLSNDRKIKIIPYDTTAEEKFQVIKNKIQNASGEHFVVEHRGATSLSISGQDEIDIYVPVSPSDFSETLPRLENIFGQAKSLYPMERARFTDEIDGKHIDIFLINKECDGYTNGVKFEAYLKSHPEALEAYRLLKEEMNGFGLRDFYRRKIEFINDILNKIELQ